MQIDCPVCYTKCNLLECPAQLRNSTWFCQHRVRYLRSTSENPRVDMLSFWWFFQQFLSSLQRRTLVGREISDEEKKHNRMSRVVRKNRCTFVVVPIHKRSYFRKKEIVRPSNNATYSVCFHPTIPPSQGGKRNSKIHVHKRIIVKTRLPINNLRINTACSSFAVRKLMEQIKILITIDLVI